MHIFGLNACFVHPTSGWKWMLNLNMNTNTKYSIPTNTKCLDREGVFLVCAVLLLNVRYSICARLCLYIVHGDTIESNFEFFGSVFIDDIAKGRDRKEWQKKIMNLNLTLYYNSFISNLSFQKSGIFFEIYFSLRMKM